MVKAFDVVGLGWVLVDSLQVVSDYPPVNTKTRSLIGSYRQVGGPVARALVVLSRLGKKTSLIARVGDDAPGVFIRETLQSEGVETGALEVERGGESRFGHVWIANKTATRTTVYSEQCLRKMELTAEAKERVREARILHLDGRECEVALAAAKHARENECRVTLDTGSIKPGIESLIPLIDVMIASRSFADAFYRGVTPEIAGRRLQSMGPQVVVITLGSDGALVITESELFHHPSFPVRAVDTNGAGDAFSGGLLFGLLEDWDLARSVRFASAVSALKCKRLGNQGLPRLSEVRDFIRLSMNAT